MKRTKIGLALVAALVLAGGVYWASQRETDPKKNDDTAKLETLVKPEASGKPSLKPGYETPTPDQAWQTAATKTAQFAPVSNYGRTPETPKELLANLQGQSNIDGLKEPTKFPERLNPMIQGAPFDTARWANDPAYKAAYLAVAEPSRGFASSRDPKAPKLQRVSAMNPIVAQGEKIELSVRSVSGAPVSFFSPHLNRFENGLTSITVVADAQGLATVTMEGVTGTHGPTDVVASSPLSSGRVTIKVETTQANDQVSK